MAITQAAPAQGTTSQTKPSKMIYLIRHGEKTTKEEKVLKEKSFTDSEKVIWSPPVQDASGVIWNPPEDSTHVLLTTDTLNTDGLHRREQLIKVFAKEHYNIGLIIAQKEDGKSKRPQETVELLAKSLNFTGSTFASSDNFNIGIGTNQFDEVRKAVEKWDQDGDILICWEHGRLINIMQALNVMNPPPYPDDRFDLIWSVPQTASDGVRQLQSITSEKTDGDTIYDGNSWGTLKATTNDDPHPIGWQEMDSNGTPIRTLEYTPTVEPGSLPIIGQPKLTSQQWTQKQGSKITQETKINQYWFRDQPTKDNENPQWARLEASKDPKAPWTYVAPGTD